MSALPCPNPCQEPAPFALLIEANRREGYVVGSPPWVGGSDLLIDCDAVGEMECAACNHNGLKACAMHRPGPGRGYRIVAWCPACGHGVDF